MKTETSPQELVNRRQFLLQATAVGGALATPVNLLPGEEKVVRVLGTRRRGRITAKPWYLPHTAAVNWQQSVSVEKK